MKPPTCTLTITLVGIWILATSTLASYTWDDVLRVSYESQEQAIARCSSQAYVGDGLIIDIRKSVSSGAQLLDGEFQSSLSACIASCCLRQECELALFKSAGESLSGKNCYFIQCVRPENCRMVSHAGFISVSMVGGKPNWEVSRHGDGDMSDGDSDTRTGHPPPPSRLTLPTTQTTPIHETTTHSSTDTDTQPPMDTPSQLKTQAPATTDENQKTTTSVSMTTTTTTTTTEEEQASEVVITDASTQPTSDKPGSEEPTQVSSSPDDDDNGEESKDESSDSESKSEQSDHTSDSHSEDGSGSSRATSDAGGTGSEELADNTGLDQEDSCGRNGCDGSGIIPVAVIGSVSFVIVLLIALVVLKRVIDIRRKKRFRNVDYLINGMYT